MHRAQFLKLVDLSSEGLKSLVKRKQVRLSHDDASGWTDYAPEDALTTRLCLELANDGLPLREAAGVVADQLGALRAVRDHLNDAALEHIHFGLIRRRTDEPASVGSAIAETDWPVVGTFDFVERAYKDMARRLAEEGVDPLGRVTTVRGLRLVDVSLIAQEIRDRAEAARLPVPVFWQRTKKKRKGE